jgi:5,10-methylenetetrahydromethanopterin reductase
MRRQETGDRRQQEASSSPVSCLLSPVSFRFSIAFQSDKTPGEYEALADLVDGYGFDVVSVYNDLLFQPALGPLLWMARRLRRAQLGPAALNPYTVHPLEIAGQVALLDLASEGRAYLGLARGAWLDALGVEAARPIATLREAVLLVKHLLARRPDAFRGQIFSLAAGATLRYRPLRSEVPIMIGTWGIETTRMAAEVADEIKVGGSANPAMVGHLRPSIDAGLAAAGRPRGSVGICLGAVTVVDEDREAARALARREVSLYLPVVAALDPTTRDPEWLGRIEAAAARGDYATVSRNISDAVLDRFAFAGSPADIIRQVEGIIAAGAARVEFGTPHGLDPAKGIRLIGAHVIAFFDQFRS